MRDIDLANGELHAVCLDRSADDLQRLSADFRVALNEKAFHNRSKDADLSKSTMSPDNARFWRGHVYPWDAWLYDTVCRRLRGEFRETARARVPGLEGPRKVTMHPDCSHFKPTGDSVIFSTAK